MSDCIIFLSAKNSHLCLSLLKIFGFFWLLLVECCIGNKCVLDILMCPHNNVWCIIAFHLLRILTPHHIIKQYEHQNYHLLLFQVMAWTHTRVRIPMLRIRSASTTTGAERSVIPTNLVMILVLLQAVMVHLSKTSKLIIFYYAQSIMLSIIPLYAHTLYLYLPHYFINYHVCTASIFLLSSLLCKIDWPAPDRRMWSTNVPFARQTYTIGYGHIGINLNREIWWETSLWLPFFFIINNSIFFHIKLKIKFYI